MNGCDRLCGAAQYSRRQISHAVSIPRSVFERDEKRLFTASARRFEPKEVKVQR